MTRFFSVLFGCSIILSCGQSHGQTHDSYRGYVPAYYPVCRPMGPLYHHASTAREGALNGYANVLRAVGEKRLATSAAAVNWQTARSLAVQNREEAIRAYFRSKRVNTEYRQAHLRRTSRSLVATTVAESNMRPVPAVAILDETGDIAWPKALQRPCFSRHRTRVEKIALGSTENGNEALSPLAEDIKVQLKQRIREFSPADYIAAKKFAEALASESVDEPIRRHLLANVVR